MPGRAVIGRIADWFGSWGYTDARELPHQYSACGWRQQPLRLCSVALYWDAMEEQSLTVKRLNRPAGGASRAANTLDLRQQAAIPAPTEAVGVAGELHEVDFGSVDTAVINYGVDAQTAAAATHQEDPEEVLPWPVKPRWHHRLRLRLTVRRKHVLVTALTVIVATVGFVGFKAVVASTKVVTANSGDGAPVLKGEVDPTKLKGEGDGRINILLLGVGGAGHDGGTLSDTIMVASIDPAGKTVAMLSIPRDLYVKIPGYGNAKINTSTSSGGPDLAKKVVSNILDLPMHYYVQLDFAGFSQAVDAVGGINVNNPAALRDLRYPCDTGRGFCPFTMPAGIQHLDGKLALKYSRCRHGSCGSDFGRAARQQQVLLALRQKALDAATLTNPIKLNGLIDSVGDHVRTDLQPAEWQKLATIVKDLDVAKATTKVLDNSVDGLLADGSGKFPGAGSILVPRAGSFDYSEIQELAHTLFVDGYLKQENAALEIQNGTGRDGLAASIAKQLKAYSYNVVGSRTADNPSAVSRIIDYTGGKKPYTVKYLQARFKAQVQQAQRPAGAPSSPSQPELVILVGSDYKAGTIR